MNSHKRQYCQEELCTQRKKDASGEEWTVGNAMQACSTTYYAMFHVDLVEEVQDGPNHVGQAFGFGGKGQNAIVWQRSANLSCFNKQFIGLEI